MKNHFGSEGEPMVGQMNPSKFHVPHPKDWADSLPDLKRRNADLDQRDNLSWANESPYNLEGAFQREFDRMYYGEDFMKEQETRGSYKPREVLETIKKIEEHITKQAPVMKSALEHQIGGSNHYKDGAIQPITFITANGLSFTIGNVVKYIYRAEKKGGAEDIKKAIHYCQIELETKYGVRSEVKYQE